MRRLAIALALVMLSGCATTAERPAPSWAPPPPPAVTLPLPPCAPWQAQLVMIGVNVGLVLVAYAGERMFAPAEQQEQAPTADAPRP